MTEKLPARQEDWKQEVPTPKYEQPLLAEMVQLARQLRLQNMSKKEILETVIHEKLKNIKILEEKEMCFMGNIKPQKQIKAFSKLTSNLNTHKIERPPSEKDIRIGYELIQAVVYCPTMLMKIFRFVDQLLSSESSRTIIQTFVNIFQSGAITDETSFSLAKQFYLVLASTLNLQYGNFLLATLTSDHLQDLMRNDWPFFANKIDLVEKCLYETKCDGLKDIFQKLSIVFC